MLDHAREVGDRLFIDDRGLGLRRLPDFRQVTAGQDCQETGCHTGSIKAHPAPAGKSQLGLGTYQSRCRSRMWKKSAVGL